MSGISISGIESCIKMLEKRGDAYSKAPHEVVSKLLSIGIAKAEEGLASAQYDGTPEASISEGDWHGDNRAEFETYGRTAAFMEFGTGVTYPDNHPKAAEFGAIRGGFGKGKGKRKSWGYYGNPGTNGKLRSNGVVITHGNPANRYMLNAGIAIRQNTDRVVKEVLK